jgi:lipopolysaccharide export system permease protein
LLGIFAVVVILAQFLALINSYPDVRVSLLGICKFILLSFPSVFSYVSPIALSCALIYVFHKLVVDHEMVIWESSGASKFDLSLPVIYLGTALTLMSYLVVMVVEPIAKRELHLYKNKMINSSIPNVLEEKSFNKISDGLMLYINEHKTSSNIKGIVLHDNRSAKREISIFAEKAQILKEPGDVVLVLHNGNRLETDDLGLHTLKFAKLVFSVSASQMLTKEAQNLSLGQQLLPTLLRNASSNKLGVARELHHRFAYPLCNLLLCCMSLTIVFYGEFSRNWKISRVKHAIQLISISILTVFVLKHLAASSVIFGLILYATIFALISLSIYVLLANSENHDLRWCIHRIFRLKRAS